MCFPPGKVQNYEGLLLEKLNLKVSEKEKKNVPFPSVDHVVRKENLLRSTVQIF